MARYAIFLMKPFIDLIIVIPVGPTCKINFVLDTLSSIQHYVHCNYKVIISDDSQNSSVHDEVMRGFPDVIILKTKRSYGKGLGLYVALSRAYSFALDEFDFAALLRLDTDALIIGHNPQTPIIEYFKNHPLIGMAGRYVKGLHSPDDFGNVWDNGGRQLIVAIAKVFTRYFLRHPFIFWRVRRLLFRAINNGYELGELIFGGAYAFSHSCLETLRKNNLLPLKYVPSAPLEEDHFFTLLVISAGFGVGDLATGGGPFACTWKGLPASPQVLHEANKKIIHSTRFFADMKEDDIRMFFKSKRLAMSTELERSSNPFNPKRK
jgi:hypothetical protein